MHTTYTIQQLSYAGAYLLSKTSCLHFFRTCCEFLGTNSCLPLSCPFFLFCRWLDMATGNICPGCRGRRRRRRATRETDVGREVKQLQVQCLSCLLFCGRVKRSSSSNQVSGIHSGRGRQAGLSRWLLKIKFCCFQSIQTICLSKG